MAASDYVTTTEMQTLWRTMTAQEITRATALIPIVCNSLRVEAHKVGKDLDEMIEDDAALSDVAKSVTCDIVARVLMTSTNKEPMSQFSESALGYTVSGTFLSPGGGLFIKKAELARLGLKRQKIGVIDLCP